MNWRLPPFMIHLLLVVVAVCAVVAQWKYRVPGSAAFAVLAWIGTALSGLTLLMMIGGLVRRLPTDDRVRRVVDRCDHALTLLVFGFGLYSGALALNASFAFDREDVHATSVVALVGGEPDSWVGSAYTWVDVRSWRTRGGIERVILYPHERSALWASRPVIVSTKPGRFGMPWVVRIEPDEEAQQRAILAFAPSATRPRKQLIRSYSRRGDYDRAIGMAKEYLAEYPNDRDFATRFADELFNASRWASAVPLLEPFLRGKPDPTLYGLLGFAMTRGGRKAEGVALLEKAAALDPANWWTFYALGYAHFYDGEFSAAAAPFERVLKLRPDFPEIEERLRTIRSKKPA